MTKVTISIMNDAVNDIVNDKGHNVVHNPIPTASAKLSKQVFLVKMRVKVNLKYMLPLFHMNNKLKFLRTGNNVSFAFAFTQCKWALNNTNGGILLILKSFGAI